MLPIEQLEKLIQGKKVAFIGAGVSHKRCIEQFVELGAQVTLCDQKKSIEDFGDYADTLRRLNVALSLGEHYTDGFAGQDIIMRTPGYEYFKPELQDAKAAGAMVTSEVELFFEFCPCEIVAVTGSDGKTTTTTLISKMFEAAGRKVFLGGNIGAALLPQLADVTPDAVAVVELSSFQLISMRRSPKVAVVTNVTPNHLDHHKDMQEYIDAKRNILLWQVPPCRAVLGYENDITRAMQSDCKGEQVWFTRLHETDRGAFLRTSDDTLCYAENGVVTPVLPRAEGRQTARSAQRGKPAGSHCRRLGRACPSRRSARSAPLLRVLSTALSRSAYWMALLYYNDSIGIQSHAHHRGPAQLRPEDHPDRGRLRQTDPVRAAGPGDHRPRQGRWC